MTEGIPGATATASQRPLGHSATARAPSAATAQVNPDHWQSLTRRDRPSNDARPIQLTVRSTSVSSLVGTLRRKRQEPRPRRLVAFRLFELV